MILQRQINDFDGRYVHRTDRLSHFVSRDRDGLLGIRV